MPLARKLLLPALVIAALSLAASPAFAQDQLFNDFQSDGQVNACDYSPGQLQNGLENLPPDVQQYAPGFGDQLRAGLEAQCGGAPATTASTDTETATPTAAAGGGGGGRPSARFPRPPAPDVVGQTGTALSAPASALPSGTDVPDWVIPVVAGIAAFLLLLLFVANRLGFTLERVTGPLRASFADLGGRTTDALATAADILRFGR